MFISFTVHNICRIFIQTVLPLISNRKSTTVSSPWKATICLCHLLPITFPGFLYSQCCLSAIGNPRPSRLHGTQRIAHPQVVPLLGTCWLFQYRCYLPVTGVLQLNHLFWLRQFCTKKGTKNEIWMPMEVNLRVASASAYPGFWQIERVSLLWVFLVRMHACLFQSNPNIQFIGTVWA